MQQKHQHKCQSKGGEANETDGQYNSVPLMWFDFFYFFFMRIGVPGPKIGELKIAQSPRSRTVD